jgi:hypothetical protein
LWICLAGWDTLFIFYETNVYWYVLLAPFVILILLNRPEHLQFGLFAEIVLTNFMLLEKTCSQSWVFGGGDTFATLLLRDIFTGYSPILRGLFNQITNGYYGKLVPVYVSIIVVLSVTLLILYWPSKPQSAAQTEWSSKPLKAAVWVQIVLLFFWCICMLWGEIRLTKGVAYTYQQVSAMENVSAGDGNIVIGSGGAVYYKVASVNPGFYILTVNAENIEAENVDLSYDYNGTIPISYEILEQTDETIKVQFETEQYLDYVTLAVNNDSESEIYFESFVLSEMRE